MAQIAVILLQNYLTVRRMWIHNIGKIRYSAYSLEMRTILKM